MLKLEDIKEYGRAWTVMELRRLLNQYLQVQGSSQRHYNNCRGVELRATRYGDSRQNLSHYWSESKDGNRQPSGASWKPLLQVSKEEVRVHTLLWALVSEVNILMMNVTSTRSWMIVNNSYLFKEDAFFVWSLATCLEIVPFLRLLLLWKIETSQSGYLSREIWD